MAIKLYFDWIREVRQVLKYFRFPSKSVCGFHITEKEETVKAINKYAEENGLKIIQISACDDNGLFVVFEKMN